MGTKMKASVTTMTRDFDMNDEYKDFDLPGEDTYVMREIANGALDKK
jgi:hypothetical protein